MAKEVIYRLVDDLSGEAIPEGSGESLRFTYAGTDYEIDLSAENAAEFHDVLSRYVKAARRVSGAGTRNSSARRRSDKERLSKIRSWAVDNGHQVNARGRVAQSIIDAYEAAH